MAKKKRPFKVAAVYDTETTTVGVEDSQQAFAYAYIWNRIADVNLYQYEPERDDDITILRSELDSMNVIEQIIAEAERGGDYIPIVAAYNLMFDLQTLQADLCAEYECKVTAQTATHVYCFDLYKDDRLALRFWDTFFLDMSGLKSMGSTAGLPKAVGDLDYSLVRTPETPLTDREMFYMRRDVQVIPAYFRFLLHSHEWLTPDMLGVRVMTKTSLVRQMAVHEIYDLKPKRTSLGVMFEQLCLRELPPDFQTMSLRTAAFRGGLTFTAARTAMQIMHRVCSLDVTSMHHMYINGRRIPHKFRKADNMEFFQMVAENVANTPLDRVLKYYWQPFDFALHGVFIFKNLRLKAGSAFEFYGIATLSEGKFTDKRLTVDDDPAEVNAAVEDAARAAGWMDAATGAEFAFGKLYKAREARLCLSEVELWNVAQVYDFDSFEAIAGEFTACSMTPPDYVSLQSNILFEQKSHVKKLTKTYNPGEGYTDPIPNDIPESIADQLRAGTMTEGALNAYYNVATKAPFNGIYGTQSMQLWRPDFMVDEDGEIRLDSATKPTEDNFDDLSPERPRVLYTYGLRIVAGSRQHLVIAIRLIFERFGSAALITGGDTDSMKIALAEPYEYTDLLDALKPLHDACTAALDRVQGHNRKYFPDLVSPLTDIGIFDIEPADKKTGQIYYSDHVELWNKARVSFVNGHSHVTLAGISRPEHPEGWEGCYHIEDVLDWLLAKGYSPAEAVNLTLGYNASLAPSVAHTLMRDKPKAADEFDQDVTDYLGRTVRVKCHRAQALWPIWKTIGDTLKFSNAATVRFLEKHYRRKIDDRDKYIAIKAGTHTPRIEVGNASPVIIE